MKIPFLNAPKIIYSDRRHTLRFQNVEEFVLDGVTYYVVETDYNSAEQLIKDRSTLAKAGRMKDGFAKANMKFIVDNLDQSSPDAFQLMMSDFSDWTSIINDKDQE